MDEVHGAQLVAPEALGPEGAEANHGSEQDQANEDACCRIAG